MIRTLRAAEIRIICKSLEASVDSGAHSLAKELLNAKISINVRRVIDGFIRNPNGDAITPKMLRDDMVDSMQWEMPGNASSRWASARKRLSEMDDVEVLDYALSLGQGYKGNKDRA